MIQVNSDNFSPLYLDMLEKFTLPLNPDVNLASTLNVINAKMAHMVTSKRIMVRPIPEEKPNIVNYYGLNFISSGGGKDKLAKEVDNYLLDKFKAHFFEQVNNDEPENEEKAEETEEAEETKVVKKPKPIREPRYEIGDGTPEGVYADCEVLNELEFGSVFIRIPEFGAFIQNATQAQQGFLNFLVEAYDGSPSLKSIKAEKMKSFVQNIPVNCLLYSDTNRVINNKAGKFLNDMLDVGMVRRAFTTYVEDKPLVINENSAEDKAVKGAAYEYGKILGEKLFEIYTKIPYKAVYTPNIEAYERYYRYEIDNKKQFNRILNMPDDIIKKEVRTRHWKTLKLSAIIAALGHPETVEITLQDMEYAIYQSELLAESFREFIKITPTTDAERLYGFFMENKNQWLTKSQIDKQKFVNRAKFSRWFNENLELVKELATIGGYEIIEEPFGGYTGNSGKRYKLVDNNNGKESELLRELVDEVF